MSGRIIGIARRPLSRAPMEEVPGGILTIDRGLFGDCKGIKFPERQVTILAIEDWNEAMMALSGPAGPPDLHWTVRRANVLVEGMALPRSVGSIICLRDSLLRVTDQTWPCARMEDAYPGLLKALARNWRGGVTCKVMTGGAIALGDTARVMVELAERKIRLPA